MKNDRLKEIIKIENVELTNIIKCLKIQLESISGLAKSQQEEIKKLNDSLEEAKGWLIKIADYDENRSDFERYMEKEFGYES